MFNLVGKRVERVIFQNVRTPEKLFIIKRPSSSKPKMPKHENEVFNQR